MNTVGIRLTDVTEIQKFSCETVQIQGGHLVLFDGLKRVIGAFCPGSWIWMAVNYEKKGDEK